MYCSFKIHAIKYLFAARKVVAGMRCGLYSDWFGPLTLSCCLLLAACGGTLKTYSDDSRSTTSIATVRSATFEFAGQKYFTSITSYANWVAGQKLNFNSTNNVITGEPDTLLMLPGKYVLLTRCSVNNQWAVASVDVDLEAGATYEVSCGPVPDQLSKIHAFARKAGH